MLDDLVNTIRSWYKQDRKIRRNIAQNLSKTALAHPLDLLHNENLEDLAGVAEWVDFFSPPVCLNLYESVPLTVTKSTLFPSHCDQSKKWISRKELQNRWVEAEANQRGQTIQRPAKKVPKFRPGKGLSKKVA